MTWGNTYWPIFLVIVSALFLVPESIGIFTNSANTLSDYCWRELNVTMVFGSGKHTVAWWLSQIAWYMAVIILSLHIWYRSI